jgi:hypothetical protein
VLGVARRSHAIESMSGVDLGDGGAALAVVVFEQVAFGAVAVYV